MATSEQKPIVYVVDSDVQMRKVLTELLRSVGLESLGFGSPAEFAPTKRTDRVACLILDVPLPEQDGFELMRELASYQANLPIIVVSAHVDIRMAVEAIKGGAVNVLAKPFRDQDLLDAVQDALRRATASREVDIKMRDLCERYEALSRREKQVLHLVCAGLRNRQIAADLGIAEITVKVHRQNLVKKLGKNSIPDLVRMTDTIAAGRGSHRQSKSQS